jgi:hypothetical protein
MGLRSARGAPFEELDFCKILILISAGTTLTRYMNRAGNQVHRTGRGYPQAYLLFEERYPSPRTVEGILLQAVKR